MKARTPGPPPGVVDFDSENVDDPCAVSCYAMDVFQYLKARERSFTVSDYMPGQVLIILLLKINLLVNTQSIY